MRFLKARSINPLIFLNYFFMTAYLPSFSLAPGQLIRGLFIGLCSLITLSGFAQNPPFNTYPTVLQTAVCAGGTITVSFTAVPFEEVPSREGEVGTFDFGLQYRAQLSDATGVFDGETLTDLGEVTPGVNHNVYIPEFIPTGTSYRVRIVLGYFYEPCSECFPSRIGVQAELEDFEVFATSSPSAKFRISQPSFPSVPTVSGDNKCPGQTVRLSFAIACKFFSENTFTAQLSNATGSFEAPVDLGSVNPGTLNNVLIPLRTPAGTGYKIRVVSSNPEVTSSASSNFKVKACPSNNNREVAPEEVGLQVRVSPNPATDGRLKIALGGVEGQKLSVALFNGMGQPVRQQAIERAGEEEILDWDITRQPQGLYLLRVSSGKEAKTVKVLH